jgi:hypothetical protein
VTATSAVASAIMDLVSEFIIRIWLPSMSGAILPDVGPSA